MGAGASIPIGLENLVEDTSPEAGGDLDFGAYDAQFDDGSYVMLGSSQDVTMEYDGTDFQATILSGNYVYDLPGAWAARTSMFVIQGRAGASANAPLLKLDAYGTGSGNAGVFQCLVNSVAIFSIDNEGDVVCGATVTSGGLRMDGGTSPNRIRLTDGLEIGAYSSTASIHKVAMGIGTFQAITVGDNVDQADVTIMREFDGNSLRSEAGTALRIERNMTNVTAENGNFLECGDTSSSIVLYIDKTGSLYGRHAPRTNAWSSGAYTPNADSHDLCNLLGLSAGVTINAPSGTPVDGQKLTFRIQDDGTSRALTWNATYVAIGVTLPAATTINKLTYVGCVYNSTDAAWDVVAVTTEA
jgi:hypothetical protein